MIELLVLLSTPVSGDQHPADAIRQAREWLDPIYDEIQERFLSLQGFPLIVGRSYRDLYLEEHEEWFCVDTDGRGRLFGEVRRPVGRSIADQLALAHLRGPERSFEEILREVEVERAVLDETNCPELRQVLRGFPSPEPEFQIGAPDWLRLHPRIVEVRARGSDLRVEVVDTDPDGRISSWFARSLRLLWRCAEREGTTASRTLRGVPAAACGGEVRRLFGDAGASSGDK